MARMRCNTSSKSKVESTAWPASYRTASFGMVERIVRRGKGVTEVPKVTCKADADQAVLKAIATFARCGSSRRPPGRTRNPKPCPSPGGKGGAARPEAATESEQSKLRCPG